MSLGRHLVRLLRARDAAGLPPDIEDKTRLHVADAIGIGLAACVDLPVAAQVLAAGLPALSSGPCRVLGSDWRAPPPQAAFINAARIHALDFDDIHDIARLHPTVVTLPAALAAADIAGASGTVLLRGVSLGNELMCRLGEMWAPRGEGPGSDWFLSQLFGYFGAAFAAGIVLGMDEDAIVSALGLAYMQAAGGKQAAFGVGATARSIYPAFAAMGGVQAALLARAGVTGPEQALDGPAGLFALYFQQMPDPARMTALLAPEGWAWRATQAKPWPSCRLSHPYLIAAQSVRVQLAGRRPDRVVAEVNASAAKLCHPLEARRQPTTLQDAKYSIPFMTAFMLVHGRCDLGVLGADAFQDPAVRDLAARVDIIETLPDAPGHPPAVVHAEVDGVTLTGRFEGDLDLSPAALRAKFDACLTHAGIPADAAPLWNALMNLGEQPASLTNLPVISATRPTIPSQEMHHV